MILAALVLAAYTNHAGIAISGTPVKLNAKTVVLKEEVRETSYPLSIFPEGERRRIAVDFAAATGDRSVLRIPQDIRRAVEGCDRAILRSQRRAEKKLCTEEASRALIEKTRAARKAYLDGAVKDGRLSPAERRMFD